LTADGIFHERIDPEHGILPTFLLALGISAPFPEVKLAIASFLALPIAVA
jgi:hypothetical protein